MTLDQVRTCKYTVQVLLLAAILYTYGCGQPVVYSQPVVQQPVVVQQPQQEYQVIQGPDGVQQAVFYDNGIQYVVALALFNNWMNQGGYTYVVHHYHDNPSYYHRYDRTYSSYRTVSRGSYNTYRPSGLRANNTPVQSNFRNTSPASSPSGFRRQNGTQPNATFRNTTPTPQRSGFRSTSSPIQAQRSSGFRRH